MGTTPGHGCRRELSTLTPYIVGRKAAPCSPELQGSSHMPTTSSLLSSMCLFQTITKEPSRAFPS